MVAQPIEEAWYRTVEDYRQQGLNLKEIAPLLSINYNTLRRRLSDRRRRQIPVLSIVAVPDIQVFSSPLDAIDIPEATRHFTDEVLCVDTDSFVAIGDEHAPYQHTNMIKRMIHVVRNYFPHITKLIHGGDLFNFDSLSSHFHITPGDNANESLEVGGTLVMKLGEYFEEQIFVPGNHCLRLAKKIDQPLDYRKIIYAGLAGRDPKSKLAITNISYVKAGDNWLVGHPSNFSAQGGKTPADYAEKYQMNVITFHNHQVGFAPSPRSGKWVGVDAGCMTVQREHAYAAGSFNKYANWHAGFVVVDKGYFTLFSEVFTDWSKWGC